MCQVREKMNLFIFQIFRLDSVDIIVLYNKVQSIYFQEYIVK